MTLLGEVLSVCERGLFPALAFVGAGVLLRRLKGVDPRPASRLALYILSPALVFDVLVGAHIGAKDGVGIGIFALALVAVGLVLARLSGRLLRTDRTSQVALDLTGMFSNTANLGLPLVALMLGPRSLAAAVLFVVTQVVLVNTVGAYVASAATVPARTAIRRIAGLPAPWAAVAAACVQIFDIHLPATVLTIAHEGAQAYALTVLAVLGISIGGVTLRMMRNPVTWIGTAIRLVAMPAVALLVARLLGLSTGILQALVLQIGMPVAVNAIVLSQEFGASPEAVAESIALTSLVGLLTIPFLAALLLHI